MFVNVPKIGFSSSGLGIDNNQWGRNPEYICTLDGKAYCYWANAVVIFSKSSLNRCNNLTYYYNEQFKQWIFRGESTPKKDKPTLLVYILMATVFWDIHGIIHINFFKRGKKGKTNYGE